MIIVLDTSAAIDLSLKPNKHKDIIGLHDVSC